MPDRTGKRAEFGRTAERKGNSMSSAQVKEGFNKAIIPIMAIFALGASQGGVNAGLATMGAAFPEAGPNIGYVISMVALGMIPSGIISGAVTGRFIKYRTSIIAAIVLYIVSGCWPFFMGSGESFGMLLVSRFVFGFAVGWSYPLAQALTFKTFDNENKRASILGAGMAFFNLGSLIMELAGGYLALVSWQACFLVYLIGIIPLVIVIFMLKEPERDSEQAAELAAETGGEVKTKIPPIAFLYMLMLTLIVAFAMPTILYCSFVLPDSAISGWVLSAMTLVGAVTGFTVGPVYKKLKKWTLPVAGLFLGVLYVVCALNAQPGSFNLVVYIATFLVGHWGFAIVIPATGNMITNLVPIGAATRAMGFNTAFHQAGCFLATPVATLVMGLLGAQAVTDLLLPCSIVIVVLGVLQFVLAGFTDMSKYDDGYGKVELHHDA